MNITHRVNKSGDIFYVMELDDGVEIELTKWHNEDDIMIGIGKGYDQTMTISLTNNELDQLANTINALRVEAINLARAHAM